MTAVSVFLVLLGAYALIGLLVGVWFVLTGIQSVDASAERAPLRVRLIFLPGAVALWPTVLSTVLSRRGESS